MGNGGFGYIPASSTNVSSKVQHLDQTEFTMGDYSNPILRVITDGREFLLPLHNVTRSLKSKIEMWQQIVDSTTVARGRANAREREVRQSASAEKERAFISSVSDFARARAREGGEQAGRLRVPRGLSQLHNECSAARRQNCRCAYGIRAGGARARSDEKSRIHRAAGIGSAYFRPSRNREEERPTPARSSRVDARAEREDKDARRSSSCRVEIRTLLWHSVLQSCSFLPSRMLFRCFPKFRIRLQA